VVAIQDSTKVDRRHCTLVLQEFTDIDERLSRYLGPNHLIRKDLARLMGDLRQKLTTP
jgi:hypothetical protein